MVTEFQFNHKSKIVVIVYDVLMANDSTLLIYDPNINPIKKSSLIICNSNY